MIAGRWAHRGAAQDLLSHSHTRTHCPATALLKLLLLDPQCILIPIHFNIIEQNFACSFSSAHIFWEVSYLKSNYFTVSF